MVTFPCVSSDSMSNWRKWRSSSATNAEAYAQIAFVIAEGGATDVLSAQASIDDATWRAFLQAFFQSLVASGSLELGTSVAYRTVRRRDDWWAPMLVQTSKLERIWSDYIHYGRK